MFSQRQLVEFINARRDATRIVCVHHIAISLETEGTRKDSRDEGKDVGGNAINN